MRGGTEHRNFPRQKTEVFRKVQKRKTVPPRINRKKFLAGKVLEKNRRKTEKTNRILI
jgi:hypothetical protein